jgi:hypothetical protein
MRKVGHVSFYTTGYSFRQLNQATISKQALSGRLD